MHNRYSESAKRSLYFARCEASQARSPSIRTEHLLFGITEQSADAVRRHLKLDAAVLQEQLGMKHGGPESSVPAEIPIDREVEVAIAYAIKEAKRLGDKSIEAEHLLLGIMREDQCAAAKALKSAGAPALADVRNSISEQR